ncbi:MAG: FtsK/SpoIIIE domain-containing protein [Actinomycetaceae bacterium]|nr:FtsK/SpoIIIE domain-containing protein [Actinomycetaceae bacterium]
MQKIQSFSSHLYCLAGPDAGTLFPLADDFTFLGRRTEPGDSSGVCLDDAQTSRSHVLLESSHFGVRVTDLGALNGTYWGRLFHPLPGFTLTWVLWRKLNASQAAGGLNQATGGLNHTAKSLAQRLQNGDLLKVGQNIWQLRVCGADSILGLNPADPLQKPGQSGWIQAGGTRPSKEAAALSARPHPWGGLAQNRFRQLLFSLLPIVSLTILGLRFLPASLVYLSMLLLFLGLGYLGLVRLHRRRFTAYWEPTYICHLPVKAGSKTAQFELALPPSLKFQKVLGQTHLQRLKRVGKPRRVYCPPGVTAVSGPEATAWALALALLTTLHLKIQGQTPQLTIKTAAVFVKTDQNPQTWTFTTEAGENIDLRLQLNSPAPFSGAARKQVVELFGAQTALPSVLTLETLRALTKTVGRAPQEASLEVPVGLDSEGKPYYLDLVAAGPHGMIAGTSGSGKSVALRTWLHQLCYTYTPQQLRLVLFDYKGGAALREFTSLPHVEGLVTDLVPKQAKRVLAALAAEVKDRESQLAARGFADIAHWQGSDPQTCPPRIICVVDEYKVVSQTHPQDVETLLDLCARGRSLGIHLLLATQSAAGIVTGQMRANLNLKISFRTATVADSLDLLGTAAAHQLTQSGVSLLTDPRAEGALTQVQWAYAEPQLAKTTAVTASLWRPPLAEAITELSREFPQALFVADQVEQRRHLPVQWEAGPVAVVAEDAPRQRVLQTLFAANWVDLQTYPASEWAMRLHNAVAAGQVVVVADLHRFMGQLEQQFGMGTGREVWEELCRANRKVLVGVNPADFALVRLVSQVLLHCSPTQAKQLGLAAKLVSGLTDLDVKEFLILRWPGLDTEFVSTGLAVRRASVVSEATGNAEVRLPKVSAGASVELFTRRGAEAAAELAGRRFIDALYGGGVAGIKLEVKIVGAENHIRNAESARTSTSSVRAYYGLGATEVKALKLPYFLKNTAFYAEEIWVQNGVFWDRFTP